MVGEFVGTILDETVFLQRGVTRILILDGCAPSIILPLQAGRLEEPRHATRSPGSIPFYGITLFNG